MECEIINFIIIFSVISFDFGRCHIDPIMIVHGGTDNTHQLRNDERIAGVKQATMLGYKIMKDGGSAVDAVEAAVKNMEEDIHFNAGYGAALNIDGDVELDACIMSGSNCSSGGVTGLKNVLHPISVARLIMEQSPHYYLAGEGAKRFATDHGITFISDKTFVTQQSKADLNDYINLIHEKSREEVKFGEGAGGVGAIALDSNGHVAAATSSGGLVGRLPGRVSVASVVGLGLYADDDVGAVAVTGHGEAVARYAMAHEIISALKRGFEAGVATRNVVKGVTEKFRKPTGAITVSKYGQIGISFTTEKMAWAYQIRDNIHYGVDDYDHFSEKIKLETQTRNKK